jgi:hypothetical protein
MVERLEPREILRRFGSPEYKQQRQRKMSNYQNVVFDNCERIFGKYHSWVRYSEMLLWLQPKDRGLLYVHPQVFPFDGRLGVVVSEILRYTSIKLQKNGSDLVKGSEVIRGGEHIIDVERQMDDADHLQISCRLPFSSYHMAGMVDDKACHFVNLTNMNLPARGSSNGPYPSVCAIFLKQEDAGKYRDWLVNLIHSNPEYFSWEGSNLYFSPLYPEFPKDF